MCLRNLALIPYFKDHKLVHDKIITILRENMLRFCLLNLERPIKYQGK